MTLKSDESAALEIELGSAYKFSAKRASQILSFLEDGNYRETAAKASGISKETFLQWIKRSPMFRELVDRAEAAAIAGYISVVKKAAKPHNVTRSKKVTKDEPAGVTTTEEMVVTREFDWRAAAWLAERRDPKNWRERKTIDVSQLTNEQIIALLAEDGDEGGGEAGDPAGCAGTEPVFDPA